MQTKLAAVAYAVVSIMLTACNSNNSKTNDININPNKINPSNVVKVLNRVICQDNILSCSQEEINRIWGICLRNGFSEGMPRKEVVSSRELQELVSESQETTKSRPTSYQTTDENGIVRDVQTQEEFKELVSTKGICIGSEYILK